MRSMQSVLVVALIVGVFVGIGCSAWNNNVDDTVSGKALMDEAVRSLAAGESPRELKPKTAPWPARNFALSGIIAFVVVLVGGRLLIFMQRLESQSRN